MNEVPFPNPGAALFYIWAVLSGIQSRLMILLPFCHRDVLRNPGKSPKPAKNWGKLRLRD